MDGSGHTWPRDNHYRFERDSFIEGIVISASDLGKFKTIFQIVAIIALLLHYDYHWFFSSNNPLFIVNMHNVGMFYLWIAFVITVWSGVDYLYKFIKIIAR